MVSFDELLYFIEMIFTKDLNKQTAHFQSTCRGSDLEVTEQYRLKDLKAQQPNIPHISVCTVHVSISAIPKAILLSLWCHCLAFQATHPLFTHACYNLSLVATCSGKFSSDLPRKIPLLQAQLFSQQLLYTHLCVDLIQACSPIAHCLSAQRFCTSSSLGFVLFWYWGIFLFGEQGSHKVTQFGLKLAIFLLQPPKVARIIGMDHHGQPWFYISKAQRTGLNYQNFPWWVVPLSKFLWAMLACSS